MRACESNHSCADVHRYLSECAWLAGRNRSDSANAALYLQQLTVEMLINKTEPHVCVYPNAPKVVDPAPPPCD